MCMHSLHGSSIWVNIRDCRQDSSESGYAYRHFKQTLFSTERKGREGSWDSIADRKGSISFGENLALIYIRSTSTLL